MKKGAGELEPKLGTGGCLALREARAAQICINCIVWSESGIRIVLSLQWHEWKHIIDILPLLIRCLLKGSSPPSTLCLTHSAPGLDRAFVFKLLFFYYVISSITWEKPWHGLFPYSVPPPFVSHNKRSHCIE